MTRFDNIERYRAAKPFVMTPEYKANYDYNTVGSNQNPYKEGSNDWIDYETTFEERANEYDSH